MPSESSSAAILAEPLPRTPPPSPADVPAEGPRGWTTSDMVRLAARYGSADSTLFNGTGRQTRVAGDRVIVDGPVDSDTAGRAGLTVLLEHVAPDGSFNLVSGCPDDHPVHGLASLVITDLAVLAVLPAEQGRARFRVVERSPGVTTRFLRRWTGATVVSSPAAA